jgi:hypothetical protein
MTEKLLGYDECIEYFRVKVTDSQFSEIENCELIRWIFRKRHNSPELITLNYGSAHRVATFCISIRGNRQLVKELFREYWSVHTDQHTETNQRFDDTVPSIIMLYY